MACREFWYSRKQLSWGGWFQVMSLSLLPPCFEYPVCLFPTFSVMFLFFSRFILKVMALLFLPLFSPPPVITMMCFTYCMSCSIHFVYLRPCALSPNSVSSLCVSSDLDLATMDYLVLIWPQPALTLRKFLFFCFFIHKYCWTEPTVRYAYVVYAKVQTSSSVTLIKKVN